MVAREIATTPRLARPPRAMAWVLLLASAAAVLLVGILATALVFANLGAWPTPPWAFWWRLAALSGLTIVSLALRSLRWIFLLRRADTRIPIRDAYIGYFAGLSLLFAPLLLGEVAIRAFINRKRGDVPILTTAVVNLWERGMDLVALAVIASVTTLMSGSRRPWAFLVLFLVLASTVPFVRRMALGAVIAVAGPLARVFERQGPIAFDRLASHYAWMTGVVASIVAWLLPGLGFWWLARASAQSFTMMDAEFSFAASAATGGMMLAPGGVLVAGPQMLHALSGHGMPGDLAALTVLGVRLATVGTSVALGCVFALVHVRTSAAASDTHFDDIADSYDVQIPESRRHALLDRKTVLMEEVLAARGIGARGLDVGCGQGAYVERMRAIGFDVSGIDASAGQVQIAARKAGLPDIVRLGSVLAIPAEDSSFDFLYIINVLHHLGSVEEQRRAFIELFRVLRPGGLLFVHEINTRNILFRFYMGYVFPSLNCIDEGVERWLRPDRLELYTDASVVEVRYFTFLPEFIPQAVARVLRPIERALEASSLRRYSAHYMAVLVKGSVKEDARRQ